MAFLIVSPKVFRFLQLYRSVTQGVAFIPLLIMLSLALLGLFFTLSPLVNSFNSFVYSGGYFEVRTSETARAVLTTILGGMVSLTVFGFSMMIVVVNQAASNYSPKVVETLSSQRSNQYILGVNLGTIVFALIVMMHIDNAKADGGIPELAIFIAMMLAIYCLLLFVRFINNISNSVRINNIIKFIYNKTKKSIIRRRQDDFVPSGGIDDTGWTAYCAGHSGYFQFFRTAPILEIMKEKDAVLKVLPRPGTYYLPHEALFMVNKVLDQETVAKLRAEFVTYHGEPITESPLYGFRQLREIAVKALSPGINDPGVAILCIEHLAELLSLVTDRVQEYYIVDKDDRPRIIRPDYDFTDLLELSLLPIKSYGSRDFVVLESLLRLTCQICKEELPERVWTALNETVESIVAAADACIRDLSERKVLNRKLEYIRSQGYFSPALLRI